ncbi:transposase, partial [Ectobacillus funiculus]
MILHRDVPFDGVIKKATVKREGIQYMVSLSIDYPFQTPQLPKMVSPDDVIGLDYSQEQLYVDSNGHIAGYTRYHKIMENRQRRMNQSLARKKNHAKTDENGNILYSKNYQKQVRKYQKVMAKVKNKRRDTLHKMTNQITNDYQAV